MSGGMMLVDVSGKADTVLTSKGDLATWDTKRVRKGVSATNYTGLQADSAIADGLTYGATSRSTLTGTGSILYSSSANTLAQLSAGTGEYTLKMNSGGTAPEWVNVSAGGLTVNKIQGTITSTFETTSSSHVDSGLGLTLSNQTGGNAMVIATINTGNTTDGSSARCMLANDGTQITGTNVASEPISSNSSLYQGIALSTIADTDGSVIDVYIKASGGTAKIIYSASNYTPQIIAMEFY